MRGLRLRRRLHPGRVRRVRGRRRIGRARTHLRHQRLFILRGGVGAGRRGRQVGRERPRAAPRARVIGDGPTPVPPSEGEEAPVRAVHGPADRRVRRIVSRSGGIRAGRRAECAGGSPGQEQGGALPPRARRDGPRFRG